MRTLNRQAANRMRQGRRQAPTATDRMPTVDLTPLTELIERLSRQHADLSAATAGWQARALQAEERLLQLTATIERGDDALGTIQKRVVGGGSHPYDKQSSASEVLCGRSS